jgi:hypothetical protein
MAAGCCLQAERSSARRWAFGGGARTGSRSRATASWQCSSKPPLLGSWRTRSLSPQKSSSDRLPSAWRDSACASPGRCSRPAGRGETRQRVANQESQAAEKQQRAGCRPRGAIRLAHLPGDAAVRPGAARLLSAWRTSSQGLDRAIAQRPTSTSRGSTCASSGLCSRQPARAVTVECVAKA